MLFAKRIIIGAPRPTVVRINNGADDGIPSRRAEIINDRQAISDKNNSPIVTDLYVLNGVFVVKAIRAVFGGGKPNLLTLATDQKLHDFYDRRIRPAVNIMSGLPK